MNDTSDWYDVEPLNDWCVRITEGAPVLPCHMLLVQDGGDAVLVDTGVGVGDLASLIGELVDPDVRVLLTHSHWDHIGGAHLFDDVSIHDSERGPGGRVAIDTLTDALEQRPAQFVDNYRESGRDFPDDFDPDSYGIEPTEGVGRLEPGQEIEVGDVTLELVPIPGHSPGQLGVLDRRSGILHGADVLEPGGEVYAILEGADLEAYRDTIDRLIDLRDEEAYDTLMISHGDPIQGSDLGMLDDVRVALEAVVNGEAEYDVIADERFGGIRQFEIDGIEVWMKDE